MGSGFNFRYNSGILSGATNIVENQINYVFDVFQTETVLMYDALNLFMESINSWYENNDPIKHSSLSCTGSEISLSGYNITSLLRIV